MPPAALAHPPRRLKGTARNDGVLTYDRFRSQRRVEYLDWWKQLGSNERMADVQDFVAAQGRGGGLSRRNSRPYLF